MKHMKISSAIVSDAEDSTIAYARQIKDETQDKFQSEINTELAQAIANKITTNDGIVTQETGDSTTSVMSQKAVSYLLNSGYLFAGIATPETEPIVPVRKVFYLAFLKGQYPNFDIENSNYELIIIAYINGTWEKIETNFAMSGIKYKTNLNVGILYPNGAIDGNTQFANWRYTDFIKVKSDSIIFSNIGRQPGNTYASLNIYDDSKNVLSSFNIDNKPYMVNINEDGYIRLCGYKDEAIEAFNLNLSDFAEMNDDIDSIKSSLKPLQKINFAYEGGIIQTSGSILELDNWHHTDYIKVHEGEILHIDGAETLPGNIYPVIQIYNDDKTILDNIYTENFKSILNLENSGFIRINSYINDLLNIGKENNIQGVQNQITVLSNDIPLYVNYVGMSIWYNDGRILGSGVGGNEYAIGYQSIINSIFNFKINTGTQYCYPGCSLGGNNLNDGSSICNVMYSWKNTGNPSIWTLDTITNDFKRNIPIGTISDYDNNTGITTYFGALRKFKDKVVELSGENIHVIVSNSLKRNNDGYTSTSTNTVEATLLDYEIALMQVAIKNKWWFVDQNRLSGIIDENLPYLTIDGLHLNNLGYKMAVIPWINVFNVIVQQLKNEIMMNNV